MIRIKSFAEQSLLFARLSGIAYKAPHDAGPLFLGLGFLSTFLNHKGSDCYIVENATDMVIVCRGTQPKQWADLSADLSIDRVRPLAGAGKVHVGFQHYINFLWPDVVPHVLRCSREHKTLWVTGHSLGAAMATLIARRCVLDDQLAIPVLFTYGSPRVGNRAFINEFNSRVVHHRWVNDGDFVTKVPLVPFYYHSGTRHHLSETRATSTVMLVVKLTLAIIPTLLAKFWGDLKDHSIDRYIQRLS
jgi:triacylglycerol lipase